jgi:hypothetical protein
LRRTATVVAAQIRLRVLKVLVQLIRWRHGFLGL